MKDFIKNVFSSALGVFLAIGIFTLIGAIFIIGSIVSGSQPAAIKDNSVLYIKLNGTLAEQAVPDPLQKILDNGDEPLGLNQLRRAIKLAKDMDEIKGIYLEAGALATDPATLQELRKSLADFKKSGKFILSYGDDYTQGDYYLCSVADKVAVNPEGGVSWKGLSSQPVFYTDALAKFGVKMQVFKVGTYKSAVEPYFRTSMSDANREQVTSFMGSIWNNFVSEVSASRKIPADSLQAYADEYLAFTPTKDLIAKKMVDTLIYIDGARNMLKKYVGIAEDKKLNMVTAADICDEEGSDIEYSSKQVAVYYAEGEIVDVAPQGYSYPQSPYIVTENVVNDMDKLLKDDDVKAVVLRINSPGGSAYASEQMWHAIKELDKKKPVVVSMGGLAASGGYYISSASQYIFAEPTTLTGSIGIFGMVPDASGLLQEKLGLKYDKVNTNKLSDFYLGNISRPLSAEEGDLVQHRIERGYQTFLSRVSEGRKKPAADVDKIGQGRVWTGEQGIKNGLVNKLGTLDDAIAYAAKKANLGDKYSAVEYPTPEPWYLNLLNKEKNNYYETQLKSTLGEYYAPFMFVKTLTSRSYIQARMPYDLNIR